MKRVPGFISIATGEWPGGMLLRLSNATSEQLKVSGWNAGQVIDLRVGLPDGDVMFEVRAWLVAAVRIAPNRDSLLPIQYRTYKPAEANRMQKYWVEAQRQVTKK